MMKDEKGMLDQSVATAYRLAKAGYAELGCHLLQQGVDRARARVRENCLGSQYLLTCWLAACDAYDIACCAPLPEEVMSDAIQ